MVRGLAINPVDPDYVDAVEKIVIQQMKKVVIILPVVFTLFLLIVSTIFFFIYLFPDWLKTKTPKSLRVSHRPKENLVTMKSAPKSGNVQMKLVLD